MQTNLIEFTSEGLYCPQADIYIDPWKPVPKAIITHAHADHARWGMQHYLAHKHSEGVLRYRLGHDINLETLDYQEKITINGVSISLHPAGHIIGSAQVRLSYKGETWVASGDYKLENDQLSTPFEPVSCHVFITESTFGMPVYRWKNQASIFEEINGWWLQNQAKGKTSLLSAYALGKAQRILQHVNHDIGPIFVHGAIANINSTLQASKSFLQEITKLPSQIDKKLVNSSLIIAPPSALHSPWIRRLRPYSIGIASGWMKIRGTKRRRAADRGFVISDHADWPALNQAVEATGAEKVYVTHGYTASFSRWLREKGIEAHEVETLYEGELAEINESAVD